MQQNLLQQHVKLESLVDASQLDTLVVNTIRENA